MERERIQIANIEKMKVRRYPIETENLIRKSEHIYTNKTWQLRWYGKIICKQHAKTDSRRDKKFE